MNTENIRTITLTSKNDRHYVVLAEWIDNVKMWKQPEKVSLCLDTKIAYARSEEWGVIARKYAEDNGIGKITVKLDPLPDPNAPKRKRGRKPRKHGLSKKRKSEIQKTKNRFRAIRKYSEERSE